MVAYPALAGSQPYRRGSYADNMQDIGGIWYGCTYHTASYTVGGVTETAIGKYPIVGVVSTIYGALLP
jgi:hypothetical protein